MKTKLIKEIERLYVVECLCKEILLTLLLARNQPNISTELQEIARQCSRIFNGDA